MHARERVGVGARTRTWTSVWSVRLPSGCVCVCYMVHVRT